MKVWSVMIVGLALVIGVFFYQDKPHSTTTSKIETVSFQGRELPVWKWKSPTQQLLSTALGKTITDFNMPTDYLLPLKTSFQINTNKKSN